MRYLIIIFILLLSGCNPCKYVAKHSECFPADTIIIKDKVIHYETEYIINDSIIRDTIPCDPITNTYYKTRTVYKTNNKIIIDTIYQSKEVSKINPINEVLKNDNEKYKNKISNRNKILISLGVVVVLLGLMLYVK